MIRQKSARPGSRSWLLRLISGDDLRDHFAGDVGQAEPPAVVFISESFVIEPEQPEDRRVEVVDVHSIDHGMIADLVGFAVVRCLP